MVVIIKKWTIKPLVSIGEVQFHSARREVRELIGLGYTEMKKSVFSKNTMDAYDSFHVFYNEDNEMEAIEFFEGNRLTLNRKTLFPGRISNAQKVIPDLKEDGECYTSVAMSIGLTISPDDPDLIESVLIGCDGYYK